MTVPQHSITSPITYIAPAAFDLDRCITERETMPDEGDGHPLSIYLRGESRYDLDAPQPVGDQVHTARDYLKPDHSFPEWKLRRLNAREVCACRDAGGDTGRRLAFSMTLSVLGRPLSDAKVDEYADTHGMAEILNVGEAALRASEAPKASEKKR